MKRIWIVYSSHVFVQVAFKLAFKPDYLEDRFALVKIVCCIYSFFNIFAKFLSASATIKEKEKYMDPTKIMIICHAEKPGTYGANTLSGVNLLGGSDGQSLVTLGWERAGRGKSLCHFLAQLITST